MCSRNAYGTGAWAGGTATPTPAPPAALPDGAKSGALPRVPVCPVAVLTSAACAMAVTAARRGEFGACAPSQRCLVTPRRTRAMPVRAVLNDPQKNSQRHVQCCPVVLQKVAQPLGHRQHPLAHGQVRKNKVHQVPRRPHAIALHYAPCGQLARGLAPPRVRPCSAPQEKRP